MNEPPTARVWSGEDATRRDRGDAQTTAVGSLVLVGILAGVIPALRAARVPPAESLKALSEGLQPPSARASDPQTRSTLRSASSG